MKQPSYRAAMSSLGAAGALLGHQLLSRGSVAVGMVLRVPEGAEMGGAVAVD